MKKYLLVSLISILFLAAACGKKQDTVDNTPLEYWTFFGGSDGEFMMQLVEKHNKENPDNQVNAVIVDWGSYYTKLSAAYLGGSLPDIGTAHSHMITPILEFYGNLVDIDSISEFDWGQFPKTTVDNITVEGKHLAIPLDTHGWAMYWNPDLVNGTSLVDANGDWIADNWEAFLSGLGEIKSMHPDVTPLAISNPGDPFRHTWYTFYRQMGGQKFITDDGYLELDEDVAKRTLDLLKDLITRGYLQYGAQAFIETFQEEKVAVGFEGVWVAGAMRQVLPKVKASTVPNFFGKNLAFGSGHVLIIPDGSKVNTSKRERAVQFSQWLVDNGALWANAGHIPSKIEVQESSEYKNNPNYVFKDLSVNLSPWPQSKYIDILLGSGTINNYFDQYITGAITDIKELIKKINEELATRR